MLFDRVQSLIGFFRVFCLFRFFEHFCLQFLVALVVSCYLVSKDLDALHDHAGFSGLTVGLDIFDCFIDDLLPVVGAVLAFTFDFLGLQLALLDLEVEVLDLVLVVYCLMILVQLLRNHDFNLKPLHHVLLFTQFHLCLLKFLILHDLLIFPKLDLFLAFVNQFVELAL